MAFIKQCCCGCSLRIGSFVVAIYSFIESLACMSLFLARFIQTEFHELKAEYEVITYSTLASFGLLMVFAALLLVGVKMEHVVLLIPWMILRIILCFYSTIFAISLVYIQSYHFKSFNVWDTCLALVLFYTAGLGVYTELVILSYYEHIRDSKARRQRRRIRRSTRDTIRNLSLPEPRSRMTELDIAVISAAFNPTTEPPEYEESPPPYYQEEEETRSNSNSRRSRNMAG